MNILILLLKRKKEQLTECLISKTNLTEKEKNELKNSLKNMKIVCSNEKGGFCKVVPDYSSWKQQIITIMDKNENTNSTNIMSCLNNCTIDNLLTCI